MSKLKYLLIIFCTVTLFAACKKSTPVEPYDPNTQFARDTTAIRAFVDLKGIAAVKDNNGIFYEILDQGSGATPTANNTVSVEYEGFVLGSNSSFDKTDGTPRDFKLRSLIGGWQIGLQKIKKGGRIRLLIPSYLAYGTAIRPGIPANSPLDFTITLQDVQ